MSAAKSLPVLMRLAVRPLVLRLAPRAPAALRGAARPAPPPRRSLCATASGTDTRYRIPPRTVPDSAILTVDDEAVGETRDFSLSSRLVQARVLYRFSALYRTAAASSRCVVPCAGTGYPCVPSQAVAWPQRRLAALPRG